MYMPAQIQLETVKRVEIEPESDVHSSAATITGTNHTGNLKWKCPKREGKRVQNGGARSGKSVHCQQRLCSPPPPRAILHVSLSPPFSFSTLTWISLVLGFVRFVGGSFIHPVGRPGPNRRLDVVVVIAGPRAQRLASQRGGLQTENGRKTVKSARHRPILSANRRRQRPAHVYARADPAQNGQNGGN